MRVGSSGAISGLHPNPSEVLDNVISYLYGKQCKSCQEPKSMKVTVLLHYLWSWSRMIVTRAEDDKKGIFSANNDKIQVFRCTNCPHMVGFR